MQQYSFLLRNSEIMDVRGDDFVSKLTLSVQPYYLQHVQVVSTVLFAVSYRYSIGLK